MRSGQDAFLTSRLNYQIQISRSPVKALTATRRYEVSGFSGLRGLEEEAAGGVGLCARELCGLSENFLFSHARSSVSMSSSSAGSQVFSSKRLYQHGILNLQAQDRSDQASPSFLLLFSSNALYRWSCTFKTWSVGL